METKEQNKIAVQKAAYFVGPLPPPNVLAEYNKIHTGFAERIMLMAEEQAKHRQAHENSRLVAEIDAAKRVDSEASRGQIFAFIIALFAISLGAFTSIKGAPWPGAIIGAGGLASIVYVFMHGKKRNP